ncbi:hypothetical protein CR513_14549, partial [Mucuna pruriens]
MTEHPLFKFALIRTIHIPIKCRLHKELVSGFLKNAKCMISLLDGEIHITHKTTHPLNMWDIKMLAQREGLVLAGEKFCQYLYPGYNNKRRDGLQCDQSFHVGECSTFIFKKWITHYSSSYKILLVGEGDFSFSLCLARAFGTAVNMVATSLDSRVTLMQKYESAPRNLSELEALGCTIVHEVSVHTMTEHSIVNRWRFDRVIFNFPHAGSLLHRELVSGFLKIAKCMLNYGGQIHITHKTKHPYSMWDIKMLAMVEKLVFVEEKKFDILLYPGYINKRGSGNYSDQSFLLGEC